MAKNSDEEDTGLEGEKPEEGEEEEDVYEEKGRDELEEEDEISPTEEAFMEGYDEDDNVAKCAKCGKPLLEEGKAFEREFKGAHYRFCSEKCARGYRFGK